MKVTHCDGIMFGWGWLPPVGVMVCGFRFPMVGLGEPGLVYNVAAIGLVGAAPVTLLVGLLSVAVVFEAMRG